MVQGLDINESKLGDKANHLIKKFPWLLKKKEIVFSKRFIKKTNTVI